MESENETRPLLHTFGKETCGSRARKRCMRIPSMLTITGIILGLFLVVVTLIIVLENLESTKEEEIRIDENLLASPFKYNKKAQDKSWQSKKDLIKNKKIYPDKDFGSGNKDWKVVPDPAGGKRPFSLLQTTGNDVNDKTGEDYKDLNQNWNDKISKLPVTSDEYGKEVDDSLEVFPELGWKDKDIRNALLKALKEEKSTLKVNALQSPKAYDQIWKDINDSWKQKLNESDKEIEKHKNINDAWKNKVKRKEEKQKDINEDWKNKVNKKAEKQKDINENWKDKMNRKTDDQKSINDEWMNKINKKAEKQKDINEDWKDKINRKSDDQKVINDEWMNKINLLQSPKASDKKWKKVDDGWKTLSNQGLSNKDIEEALINAWKERTTPQQSPMNIQDLWGKATNMLKSLLQEVTDKEETHKSMNNKWKKETNTLQHSAPYTGKKDDDEDQEWQDVSNGEWEKGMRSVESSTAQYGGNKNADKFLDVLSEYGLKNLKNSEVKGALIKTVKEREKLLQSPNELRIFVFEVVQIIKELQKERSKKNDSGSEEEKESDNPMQASMSSDNIKYQEVDDGWKKLTDQGWKDKEIKDAVYKAWKDGNKIVQSAMGYNDMKWKKVNEGWKKIHNKSVEVPTRCPFKRRQLALSASVPQPPIDCALIAEEVRKEYGRCVDLSFLPKECKPSWRIKCFSSYKYRKIDGTCNNKIHPTWGNSGIPFVRMIAPDYADGVSMIRTAKSGDPLPNARYLSTKLYSKKLRPDSNISVFFIYFGLFVDHDLLETKLHMSSIPCCDESFKKIPQDRPKECLQIEIPQDDPFYGPRNVTCLNLLRSVPVNGECGGRREQLNKATSFLDASATYGSDINQMKQLRTFSRGQLKSQIINGAPFMSFADKDGYTCGPSDEPLKCFKGGDSRLNMLVELTTMHTLWYREHNRIAAELLKLNPQWTDETIFQEARKILIGELQHITYNEFLPLLLGEKALTEYELQLDESKIYNGYDETVDPSVFNVFGSAAFRFGHSLVPDVLIPVAADNSTLGIISLHDTFFNNQILFHNGFDALIRGAVTERTQSVDSYVSKELREHLFEVKGTGYGHDLSAASIQRERDHGLPSYTKWRSACGLSDVKTWDDLSTIMNKERADALRNVYQSVEDIDLIPGSLAEHHVEDSLLGPTYRCLISRQFKKTRKGDRFWFEIQNEIGSFTKGQLDQIYKSSMARIICDNSDNIKQIQKETPFIVPSDKNLITNCEEIPEVDLMEWKFEY